MPHHPLSLYLADCRARHKTGAVTPETSYYGPLETLLNAVGQKLKKPRVCCFMSLQNQGGNMPDGGLFTQEQIPKGEEATPSGQKPARGVIEAKPFSADLTKLAAGTQVARYWKEHSQVLVTNFREFALIGRDHLGQPVRHEFYRLAASEKEFWQLAAKPEQAEKEHGPRLLDFLERCLRRPAPLTDPKDVAWFLASYARDARSRVEHSKAHKQVETVRKALEQSLGLKVLDEKGEHFFQSTLVQTLFYGLFSAWVLWHRSGPAANERFNWETASKYLHVPILRKLFRELTDPSNLDEWDNLTEVMGWAADTLNRVERGIFFEKFRETEAVQYFYEPFLEAFDPELRKQLGVWYTPPEIVKYMVARVDQVLKSDFHKPDGLADEDVYVLDPCCGTGAYLVETLSVIAATLAEKGEGATLAGRLKKAATDRVFGFEILPAPFVVAHLQLGIFLQGHGAAFNDKKHERAAVYLTNALTGWKPPTGPKQKLIFPEMEEERDAADKIKQSQPILVVIGNPPYNGFAGLPVEEEAGLVEPYRTTKTAPKPQGQGLNDLYVRFFRVAERCITERGVQHGIVCYISNYSWLDGKSHTGLRERFLEQFDEIWIDSLHGNRIISEYAPDGRTSETVFAVAGTSPGIKVGTAITLLARTPVHTHTNCAKVLFRNWDQAKADDRRAALVASLSETDRLRHCSVVEPNPILGLPFHPMATEANYITWPLLEELFPRSFPGVISARDSFVVDIDEHELQKRIGMYFDPSVSHSEMAGVCPQAMDDANRFEAKSTRDTLLKRGLKADQFRKYVYRPFDIRWIYWEPDTKLLNEKRTEYVSQLSDQNLWITALQQNRKPYDPPVVSDELCSFHLIEQKSNFFPMLLRPVTTNGKLFAESDTSRQIDGNNANLSDAGLHYLQGMHGITDHPHLFHHTIALLHAPSYATENAPALRQDWPRVPLPAQRERLLASAEWGRQVAALLDPEAKVAGVTTGKLSPALKLIGVPTKVGGGNFTDDDYAVTARWGIAGKGGITMPGKGRVVSRPFDAAERTALEDVSGTALAAGPPTIGSTPRPAASAVPLSAIALLGEETCDIYLNENAYWKNVPRPVWEYTLGGYQVLKKWLSYREQTLLGRPLTVDEVTYFRDTIRRITTLLGLGPQLDQNYAEVKLNVYVWPMK